MSGTLIRERERDFLPLNYKLRFNFSIKLTELQQNKKSVISFAKRKH